MQVGSVFFKFRHLACAIGLIAFCGSARAEYGERNRSINGTGETLAARSFELNINTLNYGLTDDWMIAVPSLSIFTGRGAVEVRRKWMLDARWRVTPSLSAGPVPVPNYFQSAGFQFDAPPTPYSQFSVDLGADSGDVRQHSWNSGLDLRFTRGIDNRGERTTRVLGDLRFEYDYYTNGNLLYVGIGRKVPYLGYTWAWRRVYFGLVTSPLSYLIPLPYLFFRF
jgi:hypothetical protein